MSGTNPPPGDPDGTKPPPDPIDDVRKGLGLLFRAARRAIGSLPSGKVEDVVREGAREVGRALENVTQVLDREIFKRDRPGAEPPPAAPPVAGDPPKESSEEPPKGPRVG